MAKKILVVLTSHEKYPDMNRATGVWLGEAVHFVELWPGLGPAAFLEAASGHVLEPSDLLVTYERQP